MQKKFKSLRDEMNRHYQERSRELDALFNTLIAGGNIVFLGPPGTAKTDMAEQLAAKLQVPYFETLLTRTSSPEELWGPYSLKALEEGKYVRITDGTLATAKIGVVDEVFKCNSAVLNSLLSIMAYRTFRNGTNKPEVTPLKMLVGLSNEMPEGGAEGELAALWDRFEVRVKVDYVKEPKAFGSMLLLGATGFNTVITEEELDRAIYEASLVEFDDTSAAMLTGLWKEMNRAGFTISDRRWRNCVKYMKASAWLDGRKSIDEDDLDCLSNILWQNPEQYKDIRKLILAMVNPLNNRAVEIFDAVKDAVDKLAGMPEGAAKSGAAKELVQKLVKSERTLENLIEEAKNNKKKFDKISTIKSDINVIRGEVERKYLMGF